MSKQIEPTIKILIIDQHAAVREALSIRLGVVERLEVVGKVATPDEALTLLPQVVPDVIVFGLQRRDDRTMYRIAAMVSELADSAALIVLSPFADEVERQVYLNAGAKCYLLKHINTPRLIDAIVEVVESAAPPSIETVARQETWSSNDLMI